MSSYSNYIDSGAVRLSVHLEWDRLGEIACKKLSELTGRKIYAESNRSDFYGWGFNIALTPLNNEEIEKLFAVAGADEHDRDSNDFGDYPVMEINQSLAEKMLAAELPFVMRNSHADDSGVWFFGSPESKMANILVSYPETDLSPDCFRFSLKDGVSSDDLVDCFSSAMRDLAEDVEDEDSDRLTRLDAVIARVTESTGCKVINLPISFESEAI